MDTVVQIYTGPIAGAPSYTFAQVREKLAQVYARTPIHAVLVGWARDKALYRALYDFLKARGTRMFVWFPVFAELSDVHRFSPLYDAQGTIPPDTGEADFRFVCPTDPGNIDGIRRAFEASFDGVPMDGVFLDRVRLGSFAGGLRNIFSCFCPHCVHAFEEQGLDVRKVRRALMEAMRRADENPLTITGYRDLQYSFADPAIASFFAHKARLLASSLEKITGYFRERNLGVGFDLFAPSLGFFCGQDATVLLPLADFVKPMFYRHTNAPAGLPYEVNAFAAAWSGDARARRERLLSLIEAEKDDGYASFVRRELRGMDAFARKNNLSTAIFPGMEVNRHLPIAPITPEMVTESVRSLKNTPARGLCASWNLMTTPPENLDAYLSAVT